LTAIAVGVPVAVLVLGLGAFVWARERAHQKHLPPLPPQAATTSMHLNPLHPDFPGVPTNGEEPIHPHRDDSPRVDVDSSLRVPDQRASSTDAAYAVFRSTKPAEEADAAMYNVFRSEGLAQDLDVTA